MVSETGGTDKASVWTQVQLEQGDTDNSPKRTSISSRKEARSYRMEESSQESKIGKLSVEVQMGLLAEASQKVRQTNRLGSGRIRVE